MFNSIKERILRTAKALTVRKPELSIALKWDHGELSADGASHPRWDVTIIDSTGDTVATAVVRTTGMTFTDAQSGVSVDVTPPEGWVFSAAADPEKEMPVHDLVYGYYQMALTSVRAMRQ